VNRIESNHRTLQYIWAINLNFVLVRWSNGGNVSRFQWIQSSLLKIVYLSHADSFVSECRMNLAYSIIMKQIHSHSEGQGRPDCGLWLAAKREKSASAKALKIFFSNANFEIEQLQNV
jgi:hypothetical protein